MSTISDAIKKQKEPATKAKAKKTTLRKAENFVAVISAYHAFVK